MRTLLLITFTLVLSTAFAQNSFQKTNWVSTPALHKVEPAYADEAAVYIEDNKKLNFIAEKENFFLYKTVHRIIHINSDKGIEMFNKIYLPFNEGLEMVEVKARTILPDKKVIELNEKNIKDLKENDNEYKIFALDGLTKGCEVEYYYTLKMYPSFFGKEFVSYRMPVQKSSFELQSPAHLKFEVKGYNGIPDCKDTVIDDKRKLWFTALNLDAEIEEKYSMFDANLKRVDYKLSYNLANNANTRLFTWNELAKKAYSTYATSSEKESKKFKDLLSDIGIKSAMTEIEKITKIENYLKKNFIPRDDVSGDDAEDLTKAVKNKVMSERAFCKLFSILLISSDVKFQIVLCGDRNNYTIDRTFENWNNAKNTLFFFPALKSYLAPTDIFYRFPWIPPTWAGANGLFCVETALGGIKSAYAEIRPIHFQDYKYTYQNMEIKAEFTKGNDALEMDVKHSFGGYAAANYKIPFVFYPAEEQKNFLKQIVKQGTNSENILSHSFENKEMEQQDPYKPFVIQAKVKSTTLVEQAGEKIILKVGEFIGEQSQMYNERERKKHIDIDFPHALIRTIQVKIPEGYEIKNANDLKFNIVQKENDKVTLGFVSDYEIKDNILYITIKEDYVNHFYPIQLYAPFKQVINAAADFNKVTLILDKKQ